jgi:phosphoglycerate dehydrogenase-like enzyme
MRIALLDDFSGTALSFDCWRRLPPGAELVAFADHVEDADRLVARLIDFDAVIRIRERTPLPGAVLRRLPRLKLIVATGPGHRASIDLETAGELGIFVCVTGTIIRPTQEIVWAMILALFRGLVPETLSVRAGGWQVGLGRSVEGCTLGIVGLGNLGGMVAKIAPAFGMDVLAWSPNLTPERAAEHGAVAVGKAELFARSDVVSIHMPEAAATRGLVGRPEIALMRSEAFLINTSRGPLVDDEALIEALQSHRIAGAGLDVFDQEPLPRLHPYRYLPNVIATPHLGYSVREVFEIFFSDAVENIEAFMAGAPIREIRGNIGYAGAQ